MIKYELLNDHSLIIDRTGKVVPFFLASLTTDGEDKTFPARKFPGMVNVTPAPITHEWLKRLRFSPDVMPASVDESGALLEGGDYWISEDERVIINFRGGVVYCGSIVCQALHELQRLYTHITGEELQYNESI